MTRSVSERYLNEDMLEEIKDQPWCHEHTGDYQREAVHHSLGVKPGILVILSVLPSTAVSANNSS